QSGPGSVGQETNLYGFGTFQAVIDFQRSEGLPETGIVGPLTKGRIAGYGSR
ncbi:peptidoglycan-binding protein, partial [Candidatus Gracilibacteria bacterium]|nr:peptidoglycan-binding protein [Candidatus Gracilibacteria bacterium]